MRDCIATVGLDVSLDMVDKEWLDAVLEFLAPFDFDGSREKSSSVTTQQWHVLLHHCQVNADDMDCIATMKEALSTELGVLSIVSLVQNCKQLVTFLRTSGLDQTIPGLKREIEIRWNTHVEMLSSIDKNWTAVCLLNI